MLLEEVEELCVELRRSDKWRNMDEVCEEATQVAAMAMRLMVDYRCRSAEGHEPWEHYTPHLPQ